VNDIKNDHKEIGLGRGALLTRFITRSEQGQVADFVKTVINFRFSYNAGIFLTDREHVTFPRKTVPFN
jgi:hypothetical protein